MSRQLLAVALLSACVSACSSEPLVPSSEQGSEQEQMGSISLPLTAVTASASYRLSAASFTITGEALKKPKVVKPDADVPVHTEVLPAGSYSILLQNGWVLERKGTAVDDTFKPVTAQLTTPNPMLVDVAAQSISDAFFNFVTAAGDVSLGNGDLNIRIGVQDCSSYDAYTAAIATLTVDCLGTIDPKSFEVTKDGILRRTFDKCVLDESRLRPLDALLSLQFRTARLPNAQECFGGRYAAFLTQFENSGVVSCPQWKKDHTVNPIDQEVIDGIIPQLPDLPQRDEGQSRVIGAVLAQLKENNVYTVSFPEQPPGQKCETPGACAAICAGGFPGFVIEGSGESVLTDPPAWLLDTTYSSSTGDPYLKPGYYHPMSYYGGVPGVSFADAARFKPCPTCLPESCSYYAGVHVKLPLQLDCLDDADPSTCVAFCAP